MEKRVIKLNDKSPFFMELTNEKAVIDVNGRPMARAYWNLILSIRDVGLYSAGIKPHRHWKITDVKTYFGIKGDAKSMKVQLEDIRDYLTQEEQ